jgi:sugar-phosphatase
LPHHEHHNFQFDCDAVLFDLDGVLVDSRHCIENLWKGWANKHQINIDKVMHYAHGRRAVETIRLVAPQLDAERETGALELLQSIPSSAWGIATSGSRATAITRLTFAGLPVPEVLISSEDVVAGKPDPEPYLFAAMMLGAKPASCVVIEDAPAGIQAGRAAGMHVVGVISSSYPASELSQAQTLVRKLGDLSVVEAQQPALARLFVRVKGI